MAPIACLSASHIRAEASAGVECQGRLMRGPSGCRCQRKDEGCGGAALSRPLIRAATAPSWRVHPASLARALGSASWPVSLTGRSRIRCRAASLYGGALSPQGWTWKARSQAPSRHAVQWGGSVAPVAADLALDSPAPSFSRTPSGANRSEGGLAQDNSARPLGRSLSDSSRGRTQPGAEQGTLRTTRREATRRELGADP